MSAMRIAVLATGLAGSLAIAGPGAVAQAAARCAADGVHASAIADAREHVRQACPCNIPKSSGEYLRCAARIIDRDIADRLLPGQCAGQVRSWASRSVCGRDDAVVCCVKRTRGPWRPQVRAGEASCRAPRGGEACVANYPHVDDACLGDVGCWQNRCGDGVIGPLSGEECEPPSSPGCSERCRRVPCGNGVIDQGEECDPPGTSSCTALCRIDRCGNGVVDPGEACEPPGSPGCGTLCQIVSCGDGVLDVTALEECEPPGTAICDAQCRYIHTCGDRVIEPGEECDGQPQCTAECTLPRALCCDLGGMCINFLPTTDIDQYFAAKNCAMGLGGDPTHGICEGVDACDPPAPPELGCRVGSCGDRPIDPLPLCCQQATGGCRDTVATTAGAVGSFACGIFPQLMPGPVDRLMIGTCGDDGRCVPAN